jgi:hypothetical protein
MDRPLDFAWNGELYTENRAFTSKWRTTALIFKGIAGYNVKIVFF